jgi:hypothetical protein
MVYRLVPQEFKDRANKCSIVIAVAVLIPGSKQRDLTAFTFVWHLHARHFEKGQCPNS